jgi:glycosyltransferase involved in cell wall biosynthesis
MLAERAVVGTKVDAIAEIIEDGVNGLLVNPYSSEDLRIAIAKLINRPLLRKNFGKLAKQKVLKDLNPAVEQANWDRVYSRVLGISSESKVRVLVG